MNIFQQPKNTMPRIDSLYAYVSVDHEDGNEGLCGAPVGPVGCMPLIAADEKRLEQLTPIAEQMARQFKMKIRLVKFTKREVIRDIGPYDRN